MQTILVVDNDEAFRMEVCRILRIGGFRAVPARSEVESVWFAQQHHADLVITALATEERDCYHPGIPLHHLEQRMPLIRTSPARRSELVARGVLAPSAAYLQKPFPPGECLRIVGRVLRNWRPPQVA